MLEYIQCVIISAVTPRVECWCQKFKESLVFSVTPFKIDQNKNQDLLIGKTRNLTNENCKHAKILAKIQVTARFLMQDMRRDLLPKFIAICMETLY